MGQHKRRKGNSPFRLALELAESGRYQDVREVEEAFRAKHPEAVFPDHKIARGMIDGTCLRVRKERGWDI